MLHKHKRSLKPQSPHPQWLCLRVWQQIQVLMLLPPPLPLLILEGVGMPLEVMEWVGLVPLGAKVQAGTLLELLESETAKKRAVLFHLKDMQTEV
jgi:hypothetical protein